MKVLNLRCSNDHRFEGWFGSDSDFQAQGDSGRVECPICGDRTVTRLPSAPRLHVTKSRDSAPSATPADLREAQLQAHWMKAVRHVIDNTEDVGTRFPEEARRIHYGEVKERGIRGCASREETDALRDEGIQVTSLPMPDSLKGPLQ